MLIVVTELKLKGVLAWLKFLPHAVRCKIQAERAEGNLAALVSNQGLMIQRTLTAWDSKEDMQRYVRSGAHLKAMRAAPELSTREGSKTLHFEAEEVPSWEVAIRRLEKDGVGYSPEE